MPVRVKKEIMSFREWDSLYDCILLSSGLVFADTVMGNNTGNAAKKGCHNLVLCLHFEIILALGEGQSNSLLNRS
jgi:hypothetical protein